MFIFRAFDSDGKTKQSYLMSGWNNQTCQKIFLWEVEKSLVFSSSFIVTEGQTNTCTSDGSGTSALHPSAQGQLPWAQKHRGDASLLSLAKTWSCCQCSPCRRIKRLFIFEFTLQGYLRYLILNILKKCVSHKLDLSIICMSPIPWKVDVCCYKWLSMTGVKL